MEIGSFIDHNSFVISGQQQELVVLVFRKGNVLDISNILNNQIELITYSQY